MFSRYRNQHSSTGRRRNTKLWMCEKGCCSIRWKLDYAGKLLSVQIKLLLLVLTYVQCMSPEFQSYTKYAEVSPYVVVQDKTGECHCVICNGLSENFLKHAHEIRTHHRGSISENSSCATDDEEACPSEERTPVGEQQ